jgi:iron(III) transport system substrate-binding protein
MYKQGDTMILGQVKIAILVATILRLTIASAPGAEERDSILSRAKEEKTLVLYSSADLRDGTALIHAFQKNFPFIEPRLFRIGSSQIPVRVIQERRAGANLVDVIQCGDFVFYELARASIFQPYDSPERRAFPPDFKDKDGLWTSGYHNASVVAFNTSRVKAEELPKTYDDLLHPKWKGKMILDINGPEWYAGMLQVLGREKGLNLIRGLAKQNLYFSNGKVLANQILISGEYHLLINNYEHLVQSGKRRGAPIDSIAPYPVLSRVSTIALAQYAPHPNVGKLYIDFVLSEQGQKILRSFGRSSSRRGIEPDELQKRGIKLVVTDMNLAKDFARYATEFKEIFGF